MSPAERAQAAADAWRRLAEAAQEALAEVNTAADALAGNRTGAAVDGFDLSWRTLADPHLDGPLPGLVSACRRLAVQCDDYAERLTWAEV